MKIVALAGGVGGATLAHGLAQILPPEDLTIIVNTGDVIVGGVGLGRDGILSAAANNVLQGNYIGTDRSGKVALGSGSVTLSGTGNIVCGTKTGAGNVIAGGMTLLDFQDTMEVAVM